MVWVMARVMVRVIVRFRFMVTPLVWCCELVIRVTSC